MWKIEVFKYFCIWAGLGYAMMLLTEMPKKLKWVLLYLFTGGPLMWMLFIIVPIPLLIEKKEKKQ